MTNKRAIPTMLSDEDLKRCHPSIFVRIKRYFTGHSIFFHIAATILWIWALSLIFIVFSGFLISITDSRWYELNPGTYFPKELDFSNYIKAFETIQYGSTSFLGMFWNSVWYAFGCTFARLIATTLLSYVLATYKFKGRKFLFLFMIFQMMIPTYSAGVSNYVYMYEMGFVDSPLFLISQFAGHGSYFLIMYSYFQGISPVYKEAAEIDGANDFVFFRKVMLPLSTPAVLAIGIMTFTSIWADYTTPMMYLPSYSNLITGLYRYKYVSIYTLNTPVFFAGLLIAAIPTALLFIIFSDTLMNNLTIGGIKG